MGKFKEYSHPGTCAVCGKDTEVVVCASAFGAISYAYCEDCLARNLEPYHAMVDYISCAGLFPDDINEQYQKLCRHILVELGISEEKFIEDVKKSNEDIDAFYEEWEDFKREHEYIEFVCPECGAPLEVWTDYLLYERKGEFDAFDCEKRYLIRHCGKCGCDWENEWWTENGDVGESQLRRKYWG